MRLRHIEIFNAIMLTGSVSAAARLTHVTQSAASRVLQHAELQLGFALFQRVNNRLVPTDEALALHPHVVELFEKLDEIERVAQVLRSGRNTRHLRLLSILALAQDVLPRATLAFRQQLPDVRVSIRTLHSPQMVSSLVLQEADAGFLYGAIGHPALVQHTLGETPLVCVARRGVLPASRHAPTLSVLARYPMIGVDATSPLAMAVGAACRKAGVSFEPGVVVQTYHAALGMARAGVGVALVDACTALAADRTQLDVLPLMPPITLPVHAVLPSERPASVAVQAFCRCVTDALAQAPVPEG